MKLINPELFKSDKGYESVIAKTVQAVISVKEKRGFVEEN